MALCLRPTANDYIVTTSANLPSPVTIPGGLSLNLTCKKDAVEIHGLFTLTYTASIPGGAVAGSYVDTTTISIYQGTTATGTPIYTTQPLIRHHYYPANLGDAPVTVIETWKQVLQYIGYPVLAVTENTVNYTIVVTSTVTGLTTNPTVNLVEYTVSASEIPDCD